MKRNVFGLLAAIATVLAVCSCSSQGTGTGGQGDVDSVDSPAIDDAVATESAATGMAYDSLVWSERVEVDEMTSSEVDYACVFPKKGGTPLADSMRQWVLEQFGDSAYSASKNIAATVKRIGRDILKSDRDELKEVAEYNEGGRFLYYDHSTKIGIEFENDEYVTLVCQTYEYTAGAHGFAYTTGATFRKSDGRKMDWELLAGMTRSEIAREIKSGMCEYFDAASVEELLDNEMLNLSDKDKQRAYTHDYFPLPATPPYLTKDGVRLIYQQYEISCYAAGMPTCIVKKLDK